MAERGVLGLALARFDLEAGLDHVARGGEVGGGHAGDGAGGEELDDADFLVGAFAEQVALQVVVGREVDAGEGDVAQEAGAGAFVETDEAEVFDDPHGRAAGNAFNGFGDFALDLESDFHNLEGVGEDLKVGLAYVEGIGVVFFYSRVHTTWQAPAKPPASIS